MPEDMPQDAEAQTKDKSADAGPETGAVSHMLPMGADQIRQFFSLAPFAVAVFDRDMRYMAASRKWISDYRLEDQRVLGRSQYDVFPNMTDIWRDRYKRCLAGESFDEQEDRFERPDGTEWVSWKMHPWTDDNGDVAGVILFSEFVSEKKKKDQELESNQTFLEAVLDSIQEGIVACDAQGELTVFNKATKNLHGLPPERMPAEKWAEHYDLYQTDGKTPLATEEIPLVRAFNGETVERAEMVIAPSDGFPRHILANGHAMFDADGNKIGAVASMQDVTEERRATRQLALSEQQFRKLYNETPAMLHSVDREGRLIRVSEYWLKKLGYTREEVIGKPFFELLAPESLNYVKEDVLPAFVREGELENIKFKVNKKDGTPIDVQLSVVAQRDYAGVVQSSITVLTDITERTEAEADLRHSEQQFRALYDKTPAMFHSVDGRGRLIRVSAFWLEKLGYDSREVLGEPLAKFLPNSCSRKLREDVYPRIMRAGYVESVDLEIFKKDGSTIDVQLSASAEFNEDGSIKNTLTVLSDVSDRKSMEREVRRSEEQFRGAFETSPLGMALVAATTEWLMVNDALCKMLGYEKDELLKRSVRDITHPDDMDADFENVQRLMSGAQNSYQMEKRYLHKDGSTVWALISVILVRDSRGEPVHFVIQMLDLTDRKRMERAVRRSEEQFRSAFETSPQGMALIAPGGRWLTVNAALCDIFGYSNEELLELGLQNLTHPDDLDTEVEDIRRLLNGENDSFEMEKRYVHKDGQTLWGQVSISLIRDEAGEPVQFVFQMVDLTQRRDAEQQLLQAQKLEAVGQLTGGLAHDFNNLLAVILISLQLLERTHQDDPASLKRIKAALDATERGADLTHRLLAFSRKQSLEQKIIDVGALVDGMNGLLARTLGGAVRLEIHHDDDLWKVETDQGQLETAILNLAINARDAMPSGGDLTIEARNVVIDRAYAGAHSEVNAGNYVLIAVSDTGTGIPDHVLDKVFQPFFTTKEVGRGTGLGLSMVYGYLKQSKGHVEVYSEHNIGTSIKLYLPAATDAGTQEEDKAPAVVGDWVGHGERILVTEDDPAVRESVSALFNSLDYDVTEAQDAVEALAILKSEDPFDLLFTDIVMPGEMDGVALAEAALKLRPQLKILMTTGFAEVAVARGKMPAAATEIIGKPYRRDELAEKLRLVLDA